jgi:hypothetical protein
VSPNVHDVFLRFKQGEISGMAAFASEVRSVFHKCYHTFGMPEAAFISKCCEKLDLVFEQQINLLPRSLREQAVMPQPPQGGEAEGEEGGEERRRSSRARVSVQMLTTLQLVELEKRRRRGEEDKEKQRERERVRLVAEAWAAETVTPAALARVRASFDAVTVCYFCARHAERSGLPAFSLAEFEAGLGCFAAQCTLLRAALVQLLRLSETDRKAVAAQPAEPTAAWVAKALAKRIGVWALNVQNAKRIEESGDYPDEWLEPYCEDGELQELLVGLGDLDELQAALAASGLAALSLEQLSRLLRALCEQLLKLDRSVALVDAEDPSKARFLGRDSGGEARGGAWERIVRHAERCGRRPARVDAQIIARGLAQASLPGRFEVRAYAESGEHSSPVLVLDCAHNADAAVALRDALDDAYPAGEGWTRTLVVAMAADKDTAGFAETLAPGVVAARGGRVVVTSVPIAGSRSRSALPERLAALWTRAVGGDAGRVTVRASVEEALADALGRRSGSAEKLAAEGRSKHVVCVTGSVYSVAAARAALDGTT